MTTQPQTKYPGADTSKERFAEVQRNFEHAAVEEWPGSLDFLIRDLLAMIEERDAVVAAAMNWCDLHGPPTDRTSSAMKDVITAIAKFRGR